MSRLTLPVSSLIGGVSTQPEATRLPQQAELSDNCYGSLIDGLSRRPPAEHQHVYPILEAGVQHALKLTEGSYLVSTDGETELRVFDVGDGTAQTVLNHSGSLVTSADLTYLNCPNPREDLRFLTLADYTLILNRTKEVAPRGTTAVRNSQALIRIIQGAYHARYVIKVSYQGAQVAEATVETYYSDGNNPAQSGGGSTLLAEESVQTDTITQEFESLFTTGTNGPHALHTSYGIGNALPAQDWLVDRSGSVLRIQRIDQTDFDVEITESIGQTSMQVVNQEVQLFSDLPSHAPNGMVVEVIGDPEVSEFSYWVKFVAHEDTKPHNAWAEGFWEETVAPGIDAGMDWETLPHALVRQANGQWRFLALDAVPYTPQGSTEPITPPSWLYRSVGDDTTNPHPDFVGKEILDMCFHEGRLGLISDTSLTLSETREPFNLYRTTVIDVLDSERIVVQVPSKDAEILRHCVPLNGDIVLFTEETQYLLRSEGPFTPSSLTLVAAGRYDSDPVARPVLVEGMLFVPRAIGSYGAIGALQALGDQRPQLENVDITVNVPGYLDVPHNIITTPQVSIVATYGEGGTDLFLYSQFYSEGEKVHQSWQKWSFDCDSILHAWFNETELFMLVQVGTEEHLWKLRVEPEAKDGSDELTYLDRRVSTDDLPDGLTTVSSTRPSYTTTTYELPYSHAGVEARIQGSLKAVRILSIDGDEVTVEGDTTAEKLWFGVPFESRHDLSRVTQTDSQRSPVSHGILRLDQGFLSYDKSGAFNVVIMDNFGNEEVHSFSGPYLGQGANYQNVRLSTGQFVFPIRGRSEDLRISIRTAGTEAMRLVSLDVTARRNRQGSRRRQQ